MPKLPFGHAARIDHADVVKILVDAGADKEAKDKNEHTPLYIAAVRGHTEVVRILIEAGAYKEDKDKDGHIPLDFAKTREMIELLKKSVASVSS